MTKALIIKVDGTMEEKHLEKPLYRSLNSEVGGWIEFVRPATGILAKGMVMVVNEEGLLLGLDLNPIGTVIYGAGPIVGNVVILREEWKGLEIDTVSLSAEDVDRLRKMFVVTVVEHFKGCES